LLNFEEKPSANAFRLISQIYTNL